tara:strand:- start:224 stop:430 length:207 start_codon:yes stop_codon:yes gene_type:complete
MFLNKEQIKTLEKKGWTPMETEDGCACFWGKSHYTLAGHISQDTLENHNIEDIEFLVVGYSKKESKDD